MLRYLETAYRSLVAPKSLDEDGWRREYILNVLLIGSLALVLAATLIVWLDFLVLGTSYVTAFFVLGIAVWFGCLFVLSRTGKYIPSAYLLVTTFLLLAFYTLFTWGILLPEGILVLALAIVMASILLGTLAGMITAIGSGLALIVLAYLQHSRTIGLDAAWMQTTGGIGDAVGFAVTLGIITVVSWLSNREIERSLDRARRSEAQLKIERDGLEVKVIERTKELEQAQREKIMELSRFAEFGRLTSGIVHELVTPITTIALNLEQMHDEVHSERLMRAVESTKRLERYIEAARKQLQHQSEASNFELSDEIQTAVEFLQPQADKAGVQIGFIKLDKLKVYGNPIKFHQMVTNLVANAVSSYDGTKGPEKKRVAVELWKVDGSAQMVVRDWGSGIPKEHLDKIFDPFFTLKKADQGIGIGLSLSKGIVENEFGGTIEVDSDEKSGSIFTVRIPLARSHKHDKAAS